MKETTRCTRPQYVCSNEKIKLIGGTDGAMHTMALAGTMRLSGANLDFDVEGGAIGKDDIHWSTKNIKEQRCVETYLTE